MKLCYNVLQIKEKGDDPDGKKRLQPCTDGRGRGCHWPDGLPEQYQPLQSDQSDPGGACIPGHTGEAHEGCIYFSGAVHGWAVSDSVHAVGLHAKHPQSSPL